MFSSGATAWTVGFFFERYKTVRQRFGALSMQVLTRAVLSLGSDTAKTMMQANPNKIKTIRRQKSRPAHFVKSICAHKQTTVCYDAFFFVNRRCVRSEIVSGFTWTWLLWTDKGTKYIWLQMGLKQQTTWCSLAIMPFSICKNLKLYMRAIWVERIDLTWKQIEKYSCSFQVKSFLTPLWGPLWSKLYWMYVHAIR